VGAHRYTLLDVFTATPLEGNALAVVHDADGLDEATMLAVARETRLSETTFVQRAHVAGADYRNRIFTVERELPFCRASVARHRRRGRAR
jgi:trans-2,3-dihydro-3-hydroxyanthranilate isomerase